MFDNRLLWADVYYQNQWRVQKKIHTNQFRLLDPNNDQYAAGSLDDCIKRLIKHSDNVRHPINHLVILLHGIFRTHRAMKYLESEFNKRSYTTYSVNYPSLQTSVSRNTSHINRVLKRMPPFKNVSFITHSLGGIILRKIIDSPGSWIKNSRINAIVMIGTPNQGSQFAKILRSVPPLDRMSGSLFYELQRKYVKELPRPQSNLGIIAGGTGRKMGFNPLLGGDNDGTVRVESTKLESMDDFLRVSGQHSLLLRQQNVIDPVARYIVDGHF